MREPRVPTRAAIEAAIETLIALLDAIDGDADNEEGDDFAVDDEPCDPSYLWLGP